MTSNRYLHIPTTLSAAGTLFAGYLSWTRMTSGICAFSEPCPFFLGHPACYTGFALFATAFAVSAVSMLAKTESVWPVLANSIIGTAGLLFAGWMTADEVAAHAAYRLGLPTCAYGFVFFLALMIVSIAAGVSRARLSRARPHQLAPR